MSKHQRLTCYPTRWVLYSVSEASGDITEKIKVFYVSTGWQFFFRMIIRSKCILNNPKGSSTLTQGISVFNFAVGAEKLFRKKEGEKRDRYLMLGIRLGYRHCPDEYDWENALG